MKTIAVWFSCGAASAVAAKLTLDQYSSQFNVRIINNPIKEEDSDNTRFLHDVEKWLGVEIERCVNEKYPNSSCVEVWEHERFMSHPLGAPCTRTLKKGARLAWELENHATWHVLGFTAEESARAERFKTFERSNLLPILVDANLTKQDCLDILLKAGIDPPAMYKMGYPNANCVGCVKATSPTYWNHVRKTHPDVFQERAEQSRRLGAKLVRVANTRIFLDELDSELVGKPMKSLDMECGLFCGEEG